uniref:Uncharacterized protein n=1 Tax=Setaria digitata TaxID=48799 RepID=A0A915Q5L6_9BILA
MPCKINLDQNDKKLSKVANVRESISTREQQQFYGSLSRRKQGRIETNIQRVHHRSRSAGSDNLFSLRLSSPCKQSLINMSSVRCDNHSASTNGLLNPFKATKKFLKKIYDSATLPSRTHSKGSVSERNDIPTTSRSTEHSFLETKYAAELPFNEQNYECGRNITSGTYAFDTNHSSIIAPSTVKPTMLIDDTMNDSGLSRSISSSDSQKTSSGDFRSWNDVFNHLKREMVYEVLASPVIVIDNDTIKVLAGQAYMRQRDAQIFADLQFVELQLRNVKNQALASSKSDYTMSNNNTDLNCTIDNNILDRRQIKLGDLVESMPL